PTPFHGGVDGPEVVLRDVRGGQRRPGAACRAHRISVHGAEKTNAQRKWTTAYHTTMTRARGWPRERRSPSGAGTWPAWKPRDRTLTTIGMVTVHTTRQNGHSARRLTKAWYWNHVMATAASTEPTMSSTQ